jgi:hypothetical protein
MVREIEAGRRELTPDNFRDPRFAALGRAGDADSRQDEEISS